jgi:hypothetical protein
MAREKVLGALDNLTPESTAPLPAAPEAPPAAEPKKRPRTIANLSTPLQVMAAIEHSMSGLSARDRGIVAKWFSVTYAEE